MRNGRGSSGSTIVMEQNNIPLHRPNLETLMNSEPEPYRPMEDIGEAPNFSNGRGKWTGVSEISPNSSYMSTPLNGEASPYMTSPWNQFASPFNKSPWITPSTPYDNTNADQFAQRDGLIGSIVREEGHVYSLASSGDLLYTGSDSNNIRVWKNLKEFSGFKSKSGLIKAIVISGHRIYTGHQDGKIRVWKVSSKNPSRHKRVGSLPTRRDFMKCSVNPKNYVEVRRHRNVVKIKHFDAVSCLSLNEEQGLLYSGSWDKTMKVWRLSDSKCLESIDAHDDAINAVVSGCDDLTFTGSADGTVKAWKREFLGKGITSHYMDQVLLRQESAVTALASCSSSTVLYCGSSDGLINFWERDPKQPLFNHGGILRGHKKAVLCLSSGGNLIFSGSADKNICVWRRDDTSAAKGGVHTCLSVLTGHAGPVKCLAVEEDDKNTPATGKTVRDKRWIVYSGSLDKSVKVWRVSQYAPSLKDVEGYYSNQKDEKTTAEGVVSFPSPLQQQQTWQLQ